MRRVEGGRTKALQVVVVVQVPAAQRKATKAMDDKRGMMLNE